MMVLLPGHPFTCSLATVHLAGTSQRPCTCFACHVSISSFSQHFDSFQYKERQGDLARLGLCILAVSLSLTIPCPAQQESSGGSISGTATDASGAVVPGAT